MRKRILDKLACVCAAVMCVVVSYGLAYAVVAVCQAIASMTKADVGEHAIALLVLGVVGVAVLLLAITLVAIAAGVTWIWQQFRWTKHP
jgi:uncharacterized membrane protein